MSSSLNAWSRALVIALALLVVVAVLGLLLGAGYVVWDESGRTDDWDGLGTLIGLYLIGLPSLVLLVATLPALVLVRRGRAGRRGLLVAGAGLTTVTSLASAVAGVVMMDWSDAGAWLLLVVPALGLALLAVGTLGASLGAQPVRSRPPR